MKPQHVISQDQKAAEEEKDSLIIVIKLLNLCNRFRSSTIWFSFFFLFPKNWKTFLQLFTSLHVAAGMLRADKSCKSLSTTAHVWQDVTFIVRLMGRQTYWPVRPIGQRGRAHKSNTAWTHIDLGVHGRWDSLAEEVRAERRKSRGCDSTQSWAEIMIGYLKDWCWTCCLPVLPHLID